jgi:prepilin-type N-terminal cleavage/methylation domain-containing protein
MLTSAHRRSAFTLLEVIATVAVLSILAAAAVPSLTSYLTRIRIEQSAATLKDAAAGVSNFKAAVAQYPFRLSHLGRNVRVGVGGDSTTCSGVAPSTTVQTYLGTANTLWNAGKYPYFYRQVSNPGMVTPIGIISDTTNRSAPAASVGFVQITIGDVEFQDAVELNAVIDGTADANQADRSNTTLLIRWAAPVNERVKLSYNIAVGGSVC